MILSVAESCGLKGKIEFTEPQGGVVHAFVNLDLSEKKLKNRDYLVVSMDVHESIDVGTTVGVKFREERINYFDCGTGRSLAETT